METKLLYPQQENNAIAEAADILRRGGLVGIPTETVYGNDNEMDTLAGNGAYAVLQRAVPPEISEDTSEESSRPPQSGDAGVVMFVLLGSAALVGIFAALKTRFANPL